MEGSLSLRPLSDLGNHPDVRETLEAGSIYMFRAGWDVSVGLMVKNALIAIALLALGFFAYKEPLTASKIAGVGACLVGLWLINC